MDLKKVSAKISDYSKKYKYVLIIVLVGLILMILPSGSKSTTSTVTDPVIQSDIGINEKLSILLSKVDGAGKVEVMLTVSSGEETIFQTDTKFSETEQSNTAQQDTVTVADPSRNQTGLIRQINPPVYLGAVVLCQGADSASVRLSIVDAVSKATGLGANQISILKMK